MPIVYCSFDCLCLIILSMHYMDSAFELAAAIVASRNLKVPEINASAYIVGIPLKEWIAGCKNAITIAVKEYHPHVGYAFTVDLKEFILCIAVRCDDIGNEQAVRICCQQHGQ